MRGIETGKVRIRHEVFTEIARMAYEGGDYAKRLEELPFKIIPGEIGSYRDSLFLERAVVGERLRLAMGLPLRKFSEFSLLSDGVEKALDPEIYYEKPLINVIKFACNRCPDNVVKITNVCQGCLEHPCMSVCPRQAITRQNGQAHIDPDKCIRCGRCLKECKFNAIVRLERPCRKACGMDCIHSDGLGRADIDYSKCTSCGQCMVSCPFGAISDKSQIFQTIQAVKSDTPVYVALAPAFVGQFGPEGVPERIRRAFQRLGFADVYEVAIGADLCVIEEAADFLEEVPEKHKFMVTSCCPSWSDMVKKLFPQLVQQSNHISSFQNLTHSNNLFVDNKGRHTHNTVFHYFLHIGNVFDLYGKSHILYRLLCVFKLFVTGFTTCQHFDTADFSLFQIRTAIVCNAFCFAGSTAAATSASRCFLFFFLFLSKVK